MEILAYKCKKCGREINVELVDPKQSGSPMQASVAEDEARRAHARMVKRHQEFCQ